MYTNTTSNNVWFCKFCQKPFSKKYNYQSHMDRCKAYKDHLKSKCIDDAFEQQLKHDILNEVKLFLDALKDDVANVKTNKTLRNLIISR